MTRGRGRIGQACPTIRAQYDVSEIRAATTEFLFTRVSRAVQQEAERQLQLVFPLGVPNDLTMVHIRWGDKEDEMKLRPISDYVQAAQQIVQQQQQHHKKEKEQVHIFLATEDPRAVVEFHNAAPRHWNIYVDEYFREMLPHRQVTYNGSPIMSEQLGGRPGLVALGSLLVAMEANCFVLTSASNWSRLMNELRKNVIDPRCGNCTRMIDLKYGEW